MKLKKYLEISTGHRLPNHKSKCYNLHGHNYWVGIEIEFVNDNFINNEDGFFIDFGDVKQIVNDAYDHKFIIFKDDPFVNVLKDLPGVRLVDYIPTAENIAVEMKGLIDKKLLDLGIHYAQPTVKVFINETKNSEIEL